MVQKRTEIGIQGFGLAGALLAHSLEREGVPFCWTDEPLPSAASTMAPGIINPLAGRRFKLNRDYASARGETLATFGELEGLLGESFWHPRRFIRLLENPAQAKDLEERRKDAGPWIGELLPPDSHGPCVHDPFGSFETLHAGWLDVPRLVEALRHRYRAAEVAAAELLVTTRQRVDCRGWRCCQEPRWADLPWKNARGEVMELELENELPAHLWNGGGWLQPLAGGRWRAGATYAWSQFEAPPSLIARSELVGKLRRWLRTPYRILAQDVGVRAVLIDYRPAIGALPAEPDEHIFSGLGSHGAMQAPLFARQLASHLAHGIPLDADVAVSRFQD